MFSVLCALLPLLPFATALSSAEMRSRSVYQVVTDRFALPDGSTTKACSDSDRAYCGGTWSGITSKLDYIKGMGFDTVWISPVADNIVGSTGYGQAYHGYWTRNPDALNTNFGIDSDLRALSAALHSKGMYLMLDVVVNHVASTSGASFAANSTYGPFNNQSDYHPQCFVQNYANQTEVENCWLGDSTVALPDLRTESTTVINYWNKWVKEMVANYSIDAIRIDTVKHVPHTFWPAFTAAAGVANVGEVLDPDPAYIASYQNASINPFNYGVYYPLARAFNSTKGDLIALSNSIAQVKGNSSDTSLYGSFINNHDNARFESWVTDKAVGDEW